MFQMQTAFSNMSFPLSHKKERLILPQQPFFKPALAHLGIGLSMSTSSSGQAIQSKILRGSMKTYWQRSTHISFQGEDTLNLSSWGECKIPKVFQRKILFQCLKSHQIFSSHRDKFLTTRETLDTFQKFLETTQQRK